MNRPLLFILLLSHGGQLLLNFDRKNDGRKNLEGLYYIPSDEGTKQTIFSDVSTQDMGPPSCVRKFNNPSNSILDNAVFFKKKKKKSLLPDCHSG